MTKLKVLLASTLAFISLFAGGAGLQPPVAVYGFSCTEASARIYEGERWTGRSFLFCFEGNARDFRLLQVADCDGKWQNDTWMNCASSIITKCGSLCGYFCLNTGVHGGGEATLRIIGGYTGTFQNKFIGATPINNNFESGWWATSHTNCSF